MTTTPLPRIGSGAYGGEHGPFYAARGSSRSIGLDAYLRTLHRPGGFFWPPHMDRPAIAGECRAQALHCRLLADTTTDERARSLWASMAQMWTQLAERAERLQPAQGRASAHGDSPR